MFPAGNYRCPACCKDGALTPCPGCAAVKYCNETCLAADRERHNPECTATGDGVLTRVLGDVDRLCAMEPVRVVFLTIGQAIHAARLDEQIAPFISTMPEDEDTMSIRLCFLNRVLSEEQLGEMKARKQGPGEFVCFAEPQPFAVHPDNSEAFQLLYIPVPFIPATDTNVQIVPAILTEVLWLMEDRDTRFLLLTATRRADVLCELAWRRAQRRR